MSNPQKDAQIASTLLARHAVVVMARKLVHRGVIPAEDGAEILSFVAALVLAQGGENNTMAEAIAKELSEEAKALAGEAR